jgi:metal-responsive CopG/Arc/MetJ family transcriptional regulator
MKTISITIDERTLRAVDRAARAARRTRSEVCRLALRAWLAGARRRRLEQADREGYRRLPVRREEFEDLIAAQPLLRDEEI